MKQRANKLLFAVILGSLCCHAGAMAQKVEVKIDGRRIARTVNYLASDQQMGRKTNTAEFYRLQDWVVQQFKGWQLEPAGEAGTFYQAVPITRDYTVAYGMPRFRIDGREFYTRYDDFNIDARSRTAKTIAANILFAGYGICAPDKGLDEYADIDVKGKIVLVLKGNPGDFKPPQPRLSDRKVPAADTTADWKTESADSSKINTAYEHGAAGIIFYNPESEPVSRFSGRQRPKVEASPFQRDFVILSTVKEQVFHWILWTDPQMSSRAFSTWLSAVRSDIQLKKSRSFDTRRKAKITGYEKTVFKGEKFNDNTGRNIIAKFTGTDPKLKNQIVVIGAHFDHVGTTNGQVYNGAEDNASGSAVVFELARIMQEHKIRTKRTIVLALWTGEELGLFGSKHWVEHPTAGISIDSVIANFNMDMVGIGDTLDAPGALNFPEFWELIKKDQDPAVLAIVKPSVAGPGGSDYAPFIERGIEALALMSDAPGGHPDYHDTGDDPDKMNPDMLGKVGQFVLQGAVNLANIADTPLLIANRQNIYNGLLWPITVINPELGVERSWTIVDVHSVDELADLLTQKIAEMRQPQDNSGDFRQMMMRRFGRSSVSSGIKGADTFNHDVALLRVAKEVLSLGRVDLNGADPVWFNEGLTEEGASAVQAMEKDRCALHLQNPSTPTLMDFLEKTGKPSLISGVTVQDDSLISLIKLKKAVVCVDFDPQQVDACVQKLEEFKTALGGSDNILLNVTAKTELENGKKELYLQLIEKGWEKKDIYAIGGAGETRRSSGNLDPLPSNRPASPRGDGAE